MSRRPGLVCPVLRQACELLEEGHARRRGELLAQSCVTRPVQRPNRQADVLVAVFVRERRAAVAAESPPTLVGTLVTLRLATRPAQSVLGRARIRPEESPRRLLAHATMAAGTLPQTP